VRIAAQVVRRAADYGVPNRMHLVGDRVGRSRSNLLAVADVIVPSPATGTGMLLDLMAAGRAVAASASPPATRLLLPAAAGLLYWPGDVSAMTAAIERLLTAPPLRNWQHGQDKSLNPMGQRIVVDRP
jgi:hypothetical protein